MCNPSALRVILVPDWTGCWHQPLPEGSWGCAMGAQMASVLAHDVRNHAMMLHFPETAEPCLIY